MADVIGVTGTPGTGKKSVAPLVARKLGLECIGINDFARSAGLDNASDTGGEVDTQELRRRFEQEVSGKVLAYGHLLPYVLRRGSVRRVAVLRCEPGVLKDRLRARRYPLQKWVQNVEAELIGLVSSDTYDAFGGGRTFEVDTTFTSPEEAASVVLACVGGSGPDSPRIDWTTNYDSGAKLRLLLSGA